MSEYTPDVAAVREAFGWSGHDNYIVSNRAAKRAEFDRWLAEHDRQVAEKAWDEGWNASERFGYPVDGPDAETYKNPYRKEARP